MPSEQAPGPEISDGESVTTEAHQPVEQSPASSTSTQSPVLPVEATGPSPLNNIAVTDNHCPSPPHTHRVDSTWSSPDFDMILLSHDDSTDDSQQNNNDLDSNTVNSSTGGETASTDGVNSDDSEMTDHNSTLTATDLEEGASQGGEHSGASQLVRKRRSGDHDQSNDDKDEDEVLKRLAEHLKLNIEQRNKQIEQRNKEIEQLKKKNREEETFLGELEQRRR